MIRFAKSLECRAYHSTCDHLVSCSACKYVEALQDICCGSHVFKLGEEEVTDFTLGATHPFHLGVYEDDTVYHYAGRHDCEMTRMIA